LNWEGLQDWAYIDLANTDDGDYPFYTKLLDGSGGSAYGDRLMSIEIPLILQISSTSAVLLDTYFVAYEFWEKFVPVTTETKDQPTHVLIDKKTVYVRPVPDDTYVIKVLANLRPVALSDANDEPIEDWAEGIIKGATASLLEDDEEANTPLWWEFFNNWITMELGQELKASKEQGEEKQ
jgi:hypothetical protein